MLKKLFTDTAIYGLAPQIPKVAGVLALPVITRYLTELDFGVYGIMMSSVGVVSVLSTLGMRVPLANSFYKSPGQYRWAWRQIYGFLILWNLPYALLLALAIYFFIPQAAMEHALLIILLNVLPVVFFGPTSTIGMLHYQLNRKPIQIAWRLVVAGLLTVGFNIWFIAGMRMGYMGWFWSNCIVTMLTNVSYVIPMNMQLGLKPIFNFKRRFIRRSLKVALPTIPHYYSLFLLNVSDRLVMQQLRVPTADIGIYNGAYLVANQVQALGGAATTAVGPLMNVEYKKRNDRLARNLVFVLQLTFFGITVLLGLWLKEVFQLLIKNKAIQDSYHIGIILLMSYNYRPMYVGANNKLMYEEKTHLLVRITFVAGLINVILNIILIPIYGFAIAAYTTFVGLMYMGYASYFFKTFRRLNSSPFYPMIWLGVTVGLTVLCYFLVDALPLVKAVISIIVIGIIVPLINKFRKQ